MWINRQKKDYSIGRDAFEFFFNCIGYFNHYRYFTNELWRKVEGFENKDEADVKCAFLSSWTKHTLGINTYPVGACWCNYHGDEKLFDDYIKEWKPVFEDFDHWCDLQR